MSDMQSESPFPLYCDMFEKRLLERCKISRSIILNRWLCDVADAMVHLKNQWQSYAPKKRTDSTSRIECFLRNICGLMSKQLRDLVMKSLEHFSNVFAGFNV